MSMFDGPVTPQTPSIGSPAPVSAPAQTPPTSAPTGITPPVQQQQQVPPTQEGPGGPTARPDDHVIRSMLQQQEQTLRQRWEQENAERIELEKILRENGRDPKSIIEQYKQAKQQEEMARQAQQMGMGQVNPEFMRYLKGLEDQVKEIKTGEARREGLRLLQEGEGRNAELAKSIGIADYKTVQDHVRQFALRNGYDIEAAFKLMHYEQLTQAQKQAGAADTLLALQGRGQTTQPIPSSVPSTPGGPVDYANMPREQFADLQRRLRSGG